MPTLATGSLGPGCQWWLARLDPNEAPGGGHPSWQAGPDDLARAARMPDPAAAAFLQRRAMIAQLLGPPPVSWWCPRCGSAEHGRPLWPIGSVSTSDLTVAGVDWLLVAAGPAWVGLGVDLTTTDVRAGLARALPRYLTPEEKSATALIGPARMLARKEALGKARGSGLLGQPDPGAPGGLLDTCAPSVTAAPIPLPAQLATGLVAESVWFDRRAIAEPAKMPAMAKNSPQPQDRPEPQGSLDAVAAYYAAAPQPQQGTLLAVRAVLAQLLPNAEQVISYGVPTFKVAGKGVAGLAWYAKHCSYLPMSGSVTATLAEELAGYKTTKGAVQFPVSEPLPSAIVATLVTARLAELGLPAPK